MPTEAPSRETGVPSIGAAGADTELGIYLFSHATTPREVYLLRANQASFKALLSSSQNVLRGSWYVFLLMLRSLDNLHGKLFYCMLLKQCTVGRTCKY